MGSTARQDFRGSGCEKGLAKNGFVYWLAELKYFSRLVEKRCVLVEVFVGLEVVHARSLPKVLGAGTKKS